MGAGTDQSVFVKNRADAPPGFFAWEAAGLAWLGVATADGGARVVRVREVGERHITLERVEPARPTPPAAERLGRALALTHGAGAAAFGARRRAGPATASSAGKGSRCGRSPAGVSSTRGPG